MNSFELVSNKRRTLGLITLYMDSGSYGQKKKSAKTPLMQKTSAHTPVAKAGQTSSNTKITQNDFDVKNNSMMEAKIGIIPKVG